MNMKKTRNCWLYGLTRSAAIIALVSFPILLAKGVPDPGAYVLAVIAMLAVGTLLLGGIERYYRQRSHKTQGNGN